MWTDEMVKGIAQELNPVKKLCPIAMSEAGSRPEIRC